jgi:hypothetical protein
MSLVQTSSQMDILTRRKKAAPPRMCVDLFPSNSDVTRLAIDLRDLAIRAGFGWDYI